MNRRGFLIATSIASVSPVAAMASDERDEFHDLVQAMIDGDAAYAADPLAGEGFGPAARAYDDALVERTYGPPYARVRAGDLPVPKSAKSAAHGLRWTLDNKLLNDEEAAIVAAVLAFLDQGSALS